MNARPTRTVRAATLALSLCLLGACRDGPRDPGVGQTNSSPSARSALIAAVRSQVDESHVPVVFDSTQVRFTTAPSRVLTGLRYHWATYSPPNMPHAFAVAVAGERDGQFSVIRGVGDLAWMLRGWTPSTKQEAINGCLEEVTVAGLGRDPTHPPVLFTPSASPSDIPILNLEGIRAKASGGATAVQRADARWDVTIWSIESGGTRRYACVIPPSGATPDARQLRVVDSVPFSGLARP